MKKITRILTLILATVFIVGCFSSCKFNLLNIWQEGDEISTEENSASVGDSTEKGSDGQSEEESVEESADENAFVLTKDVLANYSIVIPMQSDDDMNAVAKVLQRSIKDATGLELTIDNDFLLRDESESEYEILVGATNRQETKDFYKDIKINDYGYAMVGKKILILGHSNAMANNAVIEFKLDVLKDASKKDVIMDSDTRSLIRGKYEKESLLINGVSVSEYTIVYPNACVKGENEIASYLQAYIAQKTGQVVRCENDSVEVSEYEIQIGDTSRITEAMEAERDASGYTRKHAYIGKTDNGLWLYGNGKSGFYTAFSKLIDKFEEKNENIALDIPASVSEKVNSLDVSAMSFNVYYDLSSDKRDPQGVITSVKQKSPDVFGLNESGKDWVELFLSDSEISGTYECAWGLAAEKGDGASYNPIFYRKDKFELVESGTKWFSSTPDRISMYPNGKHYKIMTYVILRDKTSGVEFMYLNVHLEGTNETDTELLAEVRGKQAAQIKSFVEKYNYLPIIIGGDFNEKHTSSLIKGMSTNTRFKYAMDVAKKKVDLGTTKMVSSNFNLLDEGKRSVLDYIFVTSESITVNKYEQFDNVIDGKYPSDHLPVYAEISISY